MSLSTYNAFLARGINSQTANHIINSGYTLGNLKTMETSELEALGIPNEIITQIFSEARPPIPLKTVFKLLYESKRTCCVCRDNSRPIIIHHINEWHETKDHSEDNLVVLCLNHHDEVHTKKSLSLNLSKVQIKEFKLKWTEEVKTIDAKTILGLKNEFSRWDYVNIQRVFEMFLDSNIDFRAIKSFPTLLSLNIVDNNGILTPISDWNILKKPSRYLCDFGQGVYLGHYLKEIVERLVSTLSLIDLTNNLNVSFIKSVVKVGSIITGQLGFYFSDIDVYKDGDGILNRQLRRGYYKGNSIRIEFQFDASQCTSSSGRFDALTSHKVAVPILLVRSIIEDKINKELIITGSCLSIGTWFNNHRNLQNYHNKELEEPEYKKTTQLYADDFFDTEDEDLPF